MMSRQASLQGKTSSCSESKAGSIKSTVSKETKTDLEENPNYLHGWQLILCIVGLTITNFLCALDMTISITITSAVEDRFKSFSNIGWLVSAYTLPLAVLSMPWGRSGMILGRRITIFVAIVLFEAGSLISALANSMNMLIGGRVLAGCGGAGIQVITFLVITDIVPPAERAFISTIISVSFVVASVVGPLLGGTFANSEKLTWRWCFYINLPIGGAALLFMAFGYRIGAPTQFKQFKEGSWKYKLFYSDIPGVTLITCGLTLVLLGLSFGGNEFAWESAAVILCFVLGGLIIVLFFVYEFVWFDKMTEKIASEKMYPLLSLELVKNTKVTCGMIALFFENIIFYAVNLYVTTYFEIIRGYSPLKAGLHLLPVTISGTLFSVTSGLTMAKTGIVKPFLLFASVISIVGTAVLLVFEPDSSNGIQIGLLIFTGLAYGAMLMPTLIGAQVEVRHEAPELLNIVTTLFTFTRSVGASIGSNLATAVFTAVATSKKNKYAGLKPYKINNLMAHEKLGIKLSDQDLHHLTQILMKAVHSVFYMCIAFSVITLISSLFSSNKRSEVKQKKSKNEEEANEVEEEV